MEKIIDKTFPQFSPSCTENEEITARENETDAYTQPINIRTALKPQLLSKYDICLAEDWKNHLSTQYHNNSCITVAGFKYNQDNKTTVIQQINSVHKENVKKN
uniref:Uncharacterized protein n=1 Tax=Romanomermis culicivorax TaxID=13658 RepID=A0A915KKY7_ROMCU